MRKTRHLMSYLAGIFDGEGCVSIAKAKLQPHEVNRQYQVCLVVQMSDKPVPMLFQSVFGGSLLKCQPPKGRIGNRIAWRWSMNSMQCLPVMHDLLPYVLVKRPQLEVAIHFLENKGGRKGSTGPGKPLSEEEMALREVDYILCHSLKKVGYNE